jgi:integrase/recombinase XerD
MGDDEMKYEDVPVFVRDFLSYMDTIKGKSINTVKEYYYDLRMFLRFTKKTKQNILNTPLEDIEVITLDILFIKNITLSDLYCYMAYLSQERRNTPSARARKVASIKSFYKYLHKKARLIEVDPALELETPKLQKRLPVHLDITESKNLLQSVTGKHEVRDYAILILFLNCGLRLSELVHINISQIKNESLKVLGKGGKERTIYLNKACLNALENYLKIRQKEGVKDKDALFLSERKSRISNKTVQHIVKKYIRLSGLDPNTYSTHKLRHTAATLMYQHGNVDLRSLQEILGHESITTTEIYTHIDDQQLKNAVSKNPLSGMKQRSRRE